MIQKVSTIQCLTFFLITMAYKKSDVCEILYYTCLYASIIITYFTSLVTQKETYKWSANHAALLGSEISIFDCNPTEGVRNENGNALCKACLFE